jgi:hypothetical protein
LDKIDSNSDDKSLEIGMSHFGYKIVIIVIYLLISFVYNLYIKHLLMQNISKLVDVIIEKVTNFLQKLGGTVL